MDESILATEDGRRRALVLVLTLTEGTRLEPLAYERELLDRFVWGELTLDEVEARLHLHLGPVNPMPTGESESGQLLGTAPATRNTERAFEQAHPLECEAAREAFRPVEA